MAKNRDEGLRKRKLAAFGLRSGVANLIVDKTGLISVFILLNGLLEAS